MNKWLLILIICLLITSVYGQKTSETEADYRVEKEYDKDGNLIRYDSSRVERSPGLHKQFQFHFQTDSLYRPPSILFFDSSNLLDTLFGKIKMDSLPEKYINPTKGRIMYLDSLVEKQFLPQLEDPFSAFDRGNYFFDFSDMNNQMKLFDSLMNQQFDRFEELFDRLDDWEKKQERTQDKKIL
jgi:hypothetical protein